MRHRRLTSQPSHHNINVWESPPLSAFLDLPFSNPVVTKYFTCLALVLFY